MAELSELQALVAQVRAERGFTTEPVRVFALLTEEVGEIARELKRTWSPNYGPVRQDRLAEEIADTFACLCALAEAFDVDIETSLRAKFLEKDGLRNWASAKALHEDTEQPGDADAV